MKIPERTKRYHLVLAEVSALVNTVLAIILYSQDNLNSDKTNGMMYAGLILLPFGLFLTATNAYSSTTCDGIDNVIMYILAAIPSIVYIVVLFAKNVWFGVIMLLCFLLECALVPVIEYRWRIVNKIKAHFKKKQNNK